MEITLPHGRTISVSRVDRQGDAGPVVLRVEPIATLEDRLSGRRQLEEICRTLHSPV